MNLLFNQEQIDSASTKPTPNTSDPLVVALIPVAFDRDQEKKVMDYLHDIQEEVMNNIGDSDNYPLGKLSMGWYYHPSYDPKTMVESSFGDVKISAGMADIEDNTVEIHRENDSGELVSEVISKDNLSSEYIF